jgi:hypothetical protein
MSGELASPRLSRATILAGLAGAAVVSATLVLWAHYGTTVFFEMVRTGWANCF